ncbi:MAG: regulatory protein RecX [Gaiellales bacterium]
MPERVVTRIATRSGQRLDVELDGDRWLPLAAATVVRLGLARDAPVSEKTRLEAERLAAEERALARGARLVGRRSHARDELEGRLARADGPEAARVAVDRLDALGVLDDERHARELARRRLLDGWGPERIRHDLVAAGVAADLVETSIDDIPQEDLLAAASRAIGDRTGPEAWRRLAARGFGEDMAERLLGVPPDA